MTAELTGRHYATGKPIRIRCDGGVIAQIDEVASAPERIVAPGLVDLQVNGYGGRDFTSAQLTVDEVLAIGRGLFHHGVTGYLPTVTTNSFETIAHALRVIDRACREAPEDAASVWGIHVEGPYISPHDGPRGAHPREHCRAPDWDEFQRWQEAAGGRIRLLTLSAEYDEAPAFIRRAVAAGVVVAIGHTSATTVQIAAAVDAGASMSTHLGNGAHPQIRRHPNYIWDQLADDRLTASIITDGHHLPAAVVKCFVRVKGLERIVLVSDITGMGGMPAGRYSTSLGEVEVLDDGKLVVAGQRDLLAGAALPIDHCIGNVVRFAGVQIADAIAMASTSPARIAGHKHGLQIGLPADLCLLEWQEEQGVRVVQTVLRGRTVYSAEAA